MKLFNIVENEEGANFEIEATESETSFLVNYAVCDMLYKEIIFLKENNQIILGDN